MFAPQLYRLIYIVIVFILTLYCIIHYNKYPEERIKYCNKKSLSFGPLILIIILILFIGLRPVANVFWDMMNYNMSYELIQNSEQFGFEWNWDSQNFIFDNIFNYLALNWYDIFIFFFIIAIIYFGCLYFSIKKLFPNDMLYALVVYLGALSTFNYATNGIKAGAAASIFILAFVFYKKPLIAALCCILSLGFHHAMIIPIYAFILSYFIKNPKWFFIGWFFCLVLSFFHIEGITDYLAQFADEKGQEYLLGDENDWSGKKGFRFDFILYALPPILIGYWINFRLKINNRCYNLILNTYLLSNAVWLLCMYIPYNSRIAYLSWFILPIVLIYPFLKIKLPIQQYKTLNFFTASYLAYTLFFFLTKPLL